MPDPKKSCGIERWFDALGEGVCHHYKIIAVCMLVFILYQSARTTLPKAMAPTPTPN